MEFVITDHRCADCGARGVKLWRPYMSSACRLRCAACSVASQHVASPSSVSEINNEGFWKTATPKRLTCVIGWLVPAVPVGDTYWGFGAIPDEGWEWWKKLPLRDEHRALERIAAMATAPALEEKES